MKWAMLSVQPYGEGAVVDNIDERSMEDRFGSIMVDPKLAIILEKK